MIDEVHDGELIPETILPMCPCCNRANQFLRTANYDWEVSSKRFRRFLDRSSSSEPSRSKVWLKPEASSCMTWAPSMSAYRKGMLRTSRISQKTRLEDEVVGSMECDTSSRHACQSIDGLCTNGMTSRDAWEVRIVPAIAHEACSWFHWCCFYLSVCPPLHVCVCVPFSLW